MESGIPNTVEIMSRYPDQRELILGFNIKAQKEDLVAGDVWHVVGEAVQQMSPHIIVETAIN